MNRIQNVSYTLSSYTLTKIQYKCLWNEIMSYLKFLQSLRRQLVEGNFFPSFNWIRFLWKWRQHWFKSFFPQSFPRYFVTQSSCLNPTFVKGLQVKRKKLTGFRTDKPDISFNAKEERYFKKMFQILCQRKLHPNLIPPEELSNFFL